MRLSLYDHPDGVETGPGNRVVYEIVCNEARFGAAGADGHALRWELGDDGEGAILSVKVEMTRPSSDHALRPSISHPAPWPPTRTPVWNSLPPGRLVRVDAAGQSTEWSTRSVVRTRPVPVFAAASETEHSAFVRVMLLPSVAGSDRFVI
jgi:hypothetical protein